MKAVLAIVAAAGLAGCVASPPYRPAPYVYYPQANVIAPATTPNAEVQPVYGLGTGYPVYGAYPYGYASPYPYYDPFYYPWAFGAGVGVGYWWGGHGYRHAGHHWYRGNGPGRSPGAPGGGGGRRGVRR